MNDALRDQLTITLKSINGDARASVNWDGMIRNLFIVWFNNTGEDTDEKTFGAENCHADMYLKCVIKHNLAFLVGIARNIKQCGSPTANKPTMYIYIYIYIYNIYISGSS